MSKKRSTSAVDTLLTSRREDTKIQDRRDKRLSGAFKTGMKAAEKAGLTLKEFILMRFAIHKDFQKVKSGEDPSLIVSIIKRLKKYHMSPKFMATDWKTLNEFKTKYLKEAKNGRDNSGRV